ncbi:MAG: hypothetical protein P9L99_08455 [Candidatus Lernaella stagnicola]|nr:hypothetical protein [Candidatus Lernaella stagnicola]
MNSIPQRLRVEGPDAWNYSMDGIFVAQIHLLVEFAGALDHDRLRRAARLAMDAEPVLGCRFVRRWAFPYWGRLPDAVLDRGDWLRESRDETDIDSFLAEPLVAETGPQIRVLHVALPAGDRLAIKVNHAMADAGGTKEVGYRIADIYRRLGDEPDYRPPINRGSRGLWQVVKLFAPWRLPGIFAQFVRDVRRSNKPFATVQFPAGTESGEHYRFVFHRFGPERLRALRTYAKQVDATLNDMVVAAMFRALVREAGNPNGAMLRLACTADLRRYMPGGRGEGICNISGFFWPQLPTGVGADFAETLRRVKADVDEVKKHYLGLSFVAIGTALAAPYPFGIKFWMNRKIFSHLVRSENMCPVLTNLGPIEEAALEFGSPKVRGAELVVPAARPPGLAVGLSGYGDSMTLTVGCFAPGFPPERAVAIFAAVDEELPT